MGEVSWEDEGWDELEVDLQASTEEAVVRGVRRAQEHLVAEVRKRFREPKSGRYYRVPNTTTRRWRASAPGEAPAIRLGELNRGVQAEEVVRTRDEIRGAVGVSAQRSASAYAAILEYGGIIWRVSSRGLRYAIRVLARPYLRPTFEAERGRVEEIIEEELSR